MTELRHIVPAPVVPGELQRHIDSLWRQYKAEYEKSLSSYEIENVRFTHDPEWRQRLFSIQAAHDCDLPFWKGIRVVFVLSSAAGVLSYSLF